MYSQQAFLAQCTFYLENVCNRYIHETVVSCVMVVVLFVISPKLPKCWTNPSADGK